MWLPWAAARAIAAACGGLALCASSARTPAAATDAQVQSGERDPVALYQSVPAAGIAPDRADVGSHFLYSKMGEGEIEHFRILAVDGSAPHSLSALVRFGDRVTGVPGYVHGGLTASICDELFGCLTRLRPAEPGGGTFFTARLEVDYRAPVPSGTTALVRVQATPMDGRKLWMSARMEDASSGELLVEAKSLFVLVRPRANGE
jgi:acyl-coenzyme A thioesterase PaaI-like protein